MQYRRARIEGGTYFFTVNLADRSNTLLTDRIGDLRWVLRAVKRRHAFHIDAMVVLPDHLHAVWTLPRDDANFPLRWALIKAGFSRRMPFGEHRRLSRRHKGERGIWQRRYWEHVIRDERDYARHVDYIHHNPVKHGYVRRAVEWSYSSIHRYIATGVIPSHWGADLEIDDMRVGEAQ